MSLLLKDPLCLFVRWELDGVGCVKSDLGCKSKISSIMSSQRSIFENLFCAFLEADNHSAMILIIDNDIVVGKMSFDVVKMAF